MWDLTGEREVWRDSLDVHIRRDNSRVVSSRDHREMIDSGRGSFRSPLAPSLRSSEMPREYAALATLPPIPVRRREPEQTKDWKGGNMQSNRMIKELQETIKNLQAQLNSTSNKGGQAGRGRGFNSNSSNNNSSNSSVALEAELRKRNQKIQGLEARIRQLTEEKMKSSSNSSSNSNSSSASDAANKSLKVTLSSLQQLLDEKTKALALALTDVKHANARADKISKSLESLAEEAKCHEELRKYTKLSFGNALIHSERANVRCVEKVPELEELPAEEVEGKNDIENSKKKKKSEGNDDEEDWEVMQAMYEEGEEHERLLFTSVKRTREEIVAQHKEFKAWVGEVFSNIVTKEKYKPPQVLIFPPTLTFTQRKAIIEATKETKLFFVSIPLSCLGKAVAVESEEEAKDSSKQKSGDEKSKKSNEDNEKEKKVDNKRKEEPQQTKQIVHREVVLFVCSKEAQIYMLTETLEKAVWTKKVGLPVTMLPPTTEKQRSTNSTSTSSTAASAAASSSAAASAAASASSTASSATSSATSSAIISIGVIYAPPALRKLSTLETERVGSIFAPTLRASTSKCDCLFSSSFVHYCDTLNELCRVCTNRINYKNSFQQDAKLPLALPLLTTLIHTPSSRPSLALEFLLKPLAIAWFPRMSSRSNQKNPASPSFSTYLDIFPSIFAPVATPFVLHGSRKHPLLPFPLPTLAAYGKSLLAEKAKEEWWGIKGNTKPTQYVGGGHGGGQGGGETEEGTGVCRKEVDLSNKKVYCEGEKACCSLEKVDFIANRHSLLQLAFSGEEVILQKVDNRIYIGEKELRPPKDPATALFRTVCSDLSVSSDGGEHRLVSLACLGEFKILLSSQLDAVVSSPSTNNSANTNSENNNNSNVTKEKASMNGRKEESNSSSTNSTASSSSSSAASSVTGSITHTSSSPCSCSSSSSISSPFIPSSTSSANAASSTSRTSTSASGKRSLSSNESVSPAKRNKVGSCADAREVFGEDIDPSADRGDSVALGQDRVSLELELENELSRKLVRALLGGSRYLVSGADIRSHEECEGHPADQTVYANRVASVTSSSSVFVRPSKVCVSVGALQQRELSTSLSPADPVFNEAAQQGLARLLGMLEAIKRFMITHSESTTFVLFPREDDAFCIQLCPASCRLVDLRPPAEPKSAPVLTVTAPTNIPGQVKPPVKEQKTNTPSKTPAAASSSHSTSSSSTSTSSHSAVTSTSPSSRSTASSSIVSSSSSSSTKSPTAPAHTPTPTSAVTDIPTSNKSSIKSTDEVVQHPVETPPSPTNASSSTAIDVDNSDSKLDLEDNESPKTSHTSASSEKASNSRVDTQAMDNDSPEKADVTAESVEKSSIAAADSSSPKSENTKRKRDDGSVLEIVDVDD